MRGTDLSADGVAPTPSPVDRYPSWYEQAQTRRKLRGVSLQTRLLIYFTALVFASLGLTAWLLSGQSVSENRRLTASLTQGTARALALTAAPAAARGDLASLQATADGVMHDQQLLFVGFTDARGKPLAAAAAQGAKMPELATSGLGRFSFEHDRAVGQYVRVAVPIVHASPAGSTAVGGTSTAEPTSADLLGYAIVGARLENLDESTEALFRAIVFVGAGVTLAAVAMSVLFLRHAFRPLRDLVRATKLVIAGDLDTAIYAPHGDVIGELADSFNELIKWIKGHRAQLANANNAMAASIAELERKVESRTLQLEAANDRLSSEIAEKEDFLRAVSHDLNAPLRNIGGMVTMLLTRNRDALPDEVTQRLERIKKNVDVETDLINELLELSRIKTKRQVLDLVETEALIWDLRGMFESDLKTHGIDLVLETSLPNLFGERARIRQVFQNLIDNAIKYMGDKPHAQIAIGCRVRVTEAEFYVRDTGVGIAPEDQEKVFFIFRRGRSEATQKVPGKGVGLASVKSIIETYAGRIWVQSEPGVGTTFHFTINGKYVPSVSGHVPNEMNGQPTTVGPSLASPPPKAA